MTKTLEVDNKWSIKYDDNNNDSPAGVYRYNELHQPSSLPLSNLATAMFYRILELEEFVESAFQAHPNLDLDIEATREYTSD